MQSYTPPEKSSDSTKGTATTVAWRLASKGHFAITQNEPFYFQAGYRFYKKGTDNAFKLADSPMLSFTLLVDGAHSLMLGAAALAVIATVF